MRRPKIILVISLLALLVIFFSRCFPKSSSASKDPRGSQYAGAGSCLTCHQNISSSYAHNNHFKTSSAVNMNDLKKLTASSKSDFYYTDSSRIHVGEKEGNFFQSYFVNHKEIVAAKFDMAFGSAEKAQTYGYWKENKLFQLPLTYFASMNTWANSPGFPNGYAYYNRIIESRCLECHASYVNKEVVQSGPLEVSDKFDKSTIIYGIDCERCHGPAADHVKFQQANPSVKEAKYIVSIKSLTRQQKLDVCGVCHSGNDQAIQRSLFAFVPGDTLSHFYYPFSNSGKEPDVHGKQMQLLRSSMCFQKSNMTCSSCHSNHEPEENKMDLFISKCMDCHQNSEHATSILKENEQVKGTPATVNKNCIDCHMPLQTSKVIFFNSDTTLKNIPYFLRTHKIAVYKPGT